MAWKFNPTQTIIKYQLCVRPIGRIRVDSELAQDFMAKAEVYGVTTVD